VNICARLIRADPEAMKSRMYSRLSLVISYLRQHTNEKKSGAEAGLIQISRRISRLGTKCLLR
jgi:hypothetical protein